VERGLLLRVHRGVYRVGHRAPSVEATYLGAVLAGGTGAVLCGRSAAHLLGLVKGRPPPPEVITRTERRIGGVRTRRCRELDARAAVTVRGIPTLAVPHVIVDLAPDLEDDELARVCHEAGHRYRTTPRQVEAVLADRGNARGAGKLRRIMRGDVKVTLSKLEKRFLERLEAAGLPLPETNRLAGGRRVDCRWPEYRLTVELDSYTYHSSRHAWERDRRREREARKREDDFRRYTTGDVFDHPGAMLSELRSALARPAIARP